jgi:hypothetical protein
LLVEIDGLGGVDEIADRIREALAARGIGEIDELAAS